MKKFMSILIVAVLVAALAVSSVGCQSTDVSNNDQSGTYVNDIPGGSADVSAETLEALSNSGMVTVYSYSQNGLTDAEKEFQEYFNTVYGGDLQYQQEVWEGWESRFITQFAGGDAPDVIYLYSKLWPRAANRGLVYSKADLTELGVQALDHPVITNSAELAERNFKYRNDVFGLDVYLVTPNVMLVNDSLLKECGIEKTPKDLYNEGMWNWDSFISIMAQVCSIDKDADGKSDYRGYNGWDPTYIPSTNEGYLIKADEDGKLFANTEDIKVINGLQLYNDLSTKGYMLDRGKFSEGKTATMVEIKGNIAKNIWNSGNELTFNWSVVPMPKGPDNSDGSTIGGCEAYAIVSSTQNAQGALNYIIAKNAFNKSYVEQDEEDLEYWLDDEGDQMLIDLQSKVQQKLWEGVGNIWSSQWDFWSATRSTQSVTELLTTWSPWIEAQCETENAYATH